MYYRETLSQFPPTIAHYSEIPDALKPTYQFGGSMERSVNEGSQLLMTKRMNVIDAASEEASGPE